MSNQNAEAVIPPAATPAVEVIFGTVIQINDGQGGRDKRACPPFCIIEAVGGKRIYAPFANRRQVMGVEGERSFGKTYINYRVRLADQVVCVVGTPPNPKLLAPASQWAPRSFWDSLTNAVASDDKQPKSTPVFTRENAPKVKRGQKLPSNKGRRRSRGRKSVIPLHRQAPLIEVAPPRREKVGGGEPFSAIPDDATIERVKAETEAQQEGLTPRAPKEYVPDFERDKNEFFRIMQGQKGSSRKVQVAYGQLKNLARERREQGLHSLPDTHFEIRIKGLWVRCVSDPLIEIHFDVTVAGEDQAVIA